MTTSLDTSTKVETGSGAGTFDVQRVRGDFPILGRQVRGRPLVYLDNAATSQKPQAVLDALNDYYTTTNSNVHRGLHALSERATAVYEDARRRIAGFVGAGDAHQVVFVRGATEGINLVAQSHGRSVMRSGDEVLITHMEHHSNIVPWQALCEQTGATLRVAPIDDGGALDMDALEKLITDRTRIVAAVHVSNALGTINPVGKIVDLAHQVGAVVLLDGAQAVPHGGVDVQQLNCDFYVFSGHKAFGPTGIGALIGRTALLERMPPYQYGGDMIKSVTFEKTVYNDLPYKFEAGTPHVAGAVGLGAAVSYLEALDAPGAAAHEQTLLAEATAVLREVPGLRLIGTAKAKVPVLSFVLSDVHAHDVGTILDSLGIAVRSGHHCAQPMMDRFGVPATVRASLTFYNTAEEVASLGEGLKKVLEVFA